jgi:hypothetical protein
MSFFSSGSTFIALRRHVIRKLIGGPHTAGTSHIVPLSFISVTVSCRAVSSCHNSVVLEISVCC